MKTGLLFAGQGAQSVGMGSDLYENSGLAREIYDEADTILGWGLKSLSFQGPEEKLTETAVCQPALFVHGYVLYRILEEKNCLSEVHTALGLSLGELTALTVAGAFDFSAGLRVVAERGRLMQTACESTDGTMASVLGASPEDVMELCQNYDIDMANLNCPGQIVISGNREKVAQAVSAAKEDERFLRLIPLNVAGAYHSRLMKPASEQFGAFLKGIEVREPSINVFSNTTGKLITSPDEIRTALTKQVVSSVLWEDCMRNAATLGISSFIECGPGRVLAGLSRRIDRGISVKSVSTYEDVLSLC